MNTDECTPTTPTTEYVRTVYARCPVDSLNGGPPNPTPDYAAAQFDRWLAEHDRQVAERAAARAGADVRQVDPPDCGCTECITGEYRTALNWNDYYAVNPSKRPAATPGVSVEQVRENVVRSVLHSLDTEVGYDYPDAREVAERIADEALQVAYDSLGIGASMAGGSV